MILSMDLVPMAIVIGIVVFVGGIIVALGWWKIGDRWASAENRRFKRTAPKTKPKPTGVVIDLGASSPAVPQSPSTTDDPSH